MKLYAIGVNPIFWMYDGAKVDLRDTSKAKPKEVPDRYAERLLSDINTVFEVKDVPEKKELPEEEERLEAIKEIIIEDIKQTQYEVIKENKVKIDNIVQSVGTIFGEQIVTEKPIKLMLNWKWIKEV